MDLEKRKKPENFVGNLDFLKTCSPETKENIVRGCVKDMWSVKIRTRMFEKERKNNVNKSIVVYDMNPSLSKKRDQVMILFPRLET